MDQELRSQLRETVKKVKRYNRHFNTKLFFDVFDYAMEAHKGQKRVSGEDYIWHPFNIFKILVEYEADEATLIAAILHDVVEDTFVEIDEIREKFGESISVIVDGVTKLGRIKFDSDEEQKIQNFRKMFMAMARDIRVIIIKLADRLHNMRTLSFLPEENQKKIARETMDIYAPLAHRLGMSNIKWEMEDLGFRILYESDYRKLKKDIAEKREEREQFIEEFVLQVKLLLEENGMKANISGRPKHFWSIYNKMKRQHTSIKNLYDLYAIRVVVDSVQQCYTVLGVLHTHFKPIPGRFKDYVAMPKQNLYQSIHTVLISKSGKPVEVQIRTEDMHRVSEFGVAAHWRYKERSKKEEEFEKKLSWLREFIEWQKDSDAKDFYDDLKFDLFVEEIFVFTPKGDVYQLPKKATPLDFAYRVHTSIGHRCIGAKVNSQIVNLDKPLSNGDIVEIITQNIEQPKIAWLGSVKTSSARAKIKYWFRRNTDVYEEKKETIKKQEEKKKEVEREILEPKIKQRQKKSSVGVVVEGAGDVMAYLSRCCNPMPGDGIIGYVTRGRGVAVHKKDCNNVRNSDTERLIKVEWDNSYSGTYDIALEIEASDRIGLLNDIVAKIAEMKINIVNFNLRTTPQGVAVVGLILSLTKIELLDSIMGKLRSIKDVYQVKRKGEF
ncbi:MAG: bifunctional (p)ppGpp synthetase/guanosine-3',5'-bis(diphosphate) 3'-pyrophosphohydrolase [Candidatus Margulisbacteria bacterium]|nr:bifunctional (p)ppGpp synthetase/guanosine-3',5'-bis(diphosphate) 3'-pyrophosphohydrolase [Candidatus Margulisiibacteriota bacterium]